MLDKLISERSQSKLALFRYFENRPETIFKFIEIEKDLDFSAYLIRQLISEINEDISLLPMSNDFQITIDKNQVQIEHDRHISSNILEEAYLIQSQEFSLLKAIFFNQFESKKKYAETNFLGRTSVYRLLTKVENQLAAFEISMDDKGSLVGDEKMIRHFFSTLFYKVYKDQLSFYPDDVQQQVIEFTNHLKKTYSSFQISSRFNHYLAVTMISLLNKKYLTDQKFHYQLNNVTLEKICLNWLSQFDFTEHVNKMELLSLVEHMKFSNYHAVGIYRDYKITDQYITSLTQLFETPDFNKWIQKQECNNILPDLFYEYLTVDIFKDLITRTIDISYFNENYPDLFSICLQFVKKVKKQESIFSNNYISLFLDLLLSLLAIIPDEFTKKEVNIFINFTHGVVYNEFIKQNIRSFRNHRFKFQEQIDGQTDLIISDYVPDIKLLDQTIVWLSPPRAIDWSHFGERVVELYKNNSKRVD